MRKCLKQQTNSSHLKVDFVLHNHMYLHTNNCMHINADTKNVNANNPYITVDEVGLTATICNIFSDILKIEVLSS